MEYCGLILHNLESNKDYINLYIEKRIIALDIISKVEKTMILMGCPTMSYQFRSKNTPEYLFEIRWFHLKDQEEVKTLYMYFGYKKEHAEKFLYDRPVNLDCFGISMLLEGLACYFDSNFALVKEWTEKNTIYPELSVQQTSNKES